MCSTAAIKLSSPAEQAGVCEEGWLLIEAGSAGNGLDEALDAEGRTTMTRWCTETIMTRRCTTRC